MHIALRSLSVVFISALPMLGQGQGQGNGSAPVTIVGPLPLPVVGTTTVTSSDSNPVVVRAVSVKTPFRHTFTFAIEPSTLTAKPLQLFTVPPDKRLEIEFVG